jgi:hypothetical protein
MRSCKMMSKAKMPGFTTRSGNSWLIKVKAIAYGTILSMYDNIGLVFFS